MYWCEKLSYLKIDVSMADILIELSDNTFWLRFLWLCVLNFLDWQILNITWKLYTLDWLCFCPTCCYLCIFCYTIVKMIHAYRDIVNIAARKYWLKIMKLSTHVYGVFYFFFSHKKHRYNLYACVWHFLCFVCCPSPSVNLFSIKTQLLLHGCL